MGIMGVAGDTVTFSEGLGVGSTLYLPVHVPGAKFFVGDPHYAKDGPVALEAPLRGTFRLSVLPRGSARARAGEVADYWLPRTQLDERMLRSLLESLDFLGQSSGCRARWPTRTSARRPTTPAGCSRAGPSCAARRARSRAWRARAPCRSRTGGAFVNWMSR